MAWSWSHSIEAYEAARNKLDKQNQKWLAEVWAEWQAWEREQAIVEEQKIAFEEDREEQELPAEFGENYDRDFKQCKKDMRGNPWQRELIVEEIWNRMKQQATCDNGGWNAWACPYGCHYVSFGCK